MSTPSTIKVLQPIGVLTAGTIQEFLEEFNQCLEERVKHVLIDLSKVNFIDSYGLGMLVSMHAKMRLAGGSIHLGSPNDQARCLLEIADMEKVFEIFSDRLEFYARYGNSNLAVLVE